MRRIIDYMFHGGTLSCCIVDYSVIKSFDLYNVYPGLFPPTDNQVINIYSIAPVIKYKQ